MPVTKPQFASRVPKVIGYKDLIDQVDEVHIFWDDADKTVAQVIAYASLQGKLTNLVIDRGEDVT